MIRKGFKSICAQVVETNSRKSLIPRYVVNAKRVLVTSFVLMLDWLGAPLGFAGQAHPVTLTAEVTVVNDSERDIHGYIHRFSVPVADHMQQKLIGIRYEYSEGFQRKRRRRGEGEYVELKWDIPSKSLSTRKIHFDLELSDYDYRKQNPDSAPVPNRVYLNPAKFIESDSYSIKNLALKIQNDFQQDDQKLKAAFMLPQEMIDYKVQRTKGALYAVKNGIGDCTEFSALFVAIARAMGYPARMTTDFLFTAKSEFRQPNHHAAEVYLNGGWVPVDPNLALDPKFGYGFGVGKSKKIVINRDLQWVWANRWPKDSRRASRHANVKVRWLIH